MPDGPLDGAGASPPSFILDLGRTKEGGSVYFLLIYKQKDEKLKNLVLVSGDAVFSTATSKRGLEGCVYKPQSRKSLKTMDHIAKVGQALEAVAAADAAVDAAGANGSPSSATTTAAVPKTATVALEIIGKDSAKLTVKEVKSVGAVDLAVVTLPAVNEAGNGSLLRGLLLGAVVEAHTRTKGAAAMERNRDKARKEQVKAQGLLDGAIRDKRKTVTNILEKAVLVVNAKKNRIDELEEKLEKLEDSGGSGDEQASICDSRVSGGEKDDVHTDDEGRNPPPETTKRKGKAASRAQPPGTRDAEPTTGKNNSSGSTRRGATAAAASAAAGGGAAAGAGGGGPSSPSARGRGSGRGGGGKVKVKSEPKLGAGGGALATPMGTQELSQDELFELVDAKDKTEGAGVNSGDRDSDGIDTSRLGNEREDGGRGSRSSLKHPSSSGDPGDMDQEEENEDDGMGEGAGCGEAALYVGDLGGSSDSDDDGNAGQASQRVRRRKKPKKSSKTAATAQGGSGSGGGGSGAVAAAAGVATGHSSAGGGASGGAAESTGRSIWEQLTEDSDEDLTGMK